MSAIITDQIRILNAKNFVAGVKTSTNSFYTFIGLPNSSEVQSDWDTNPPAPKDCFDEENSYWDTMLALKKINKSDARQVVAKRFWSSGNIYDMYRHDYNRSNVAKVSGSTSLYSAFYYVINSNYSVYICLQNGTTPETPNGRPSLDEPTFTDLEPRAAGTSGDGYIWKYLYTIKPGEIVKFESTDFIPVPDDWETSTDNSAVRDNAVDGSIKTIVIKNRGANIGSSGSPQTYYNVPISGDGTGATCTITTNNNAEIDSVSVSNQGSGYTFGTVDLVTGGVPTGSTRPVLDVIIPPKGGHGKDIYRELGAYYVLLYSRIENDNQNPDFITGNQFSRIGIVQNPNSVGGSQLTLDKASTVYALRLTGIGYSSAVFSADSYIYQTIATGTTAVGRVVSYDQTTGVLKYWQDRSLSGFTTVGVAITNPTYGFVLNEFTSSPTSGNITITGGSVNLSISTSFTGLSTVINNRTYYLGQSFTNGVASPEVQKYSGNIVYVDNRPSITRSSNQKEDIKVILQF